MITNKYRMTFKEFPAIMNTGGGNQMHMDAKVKTSMGFPEFQDEAGEYCSHNR